MTHALTRPHRTLSVGGAIAAIAVAAAFAVAQPTRAAGGGQVEHLPVSDFIDAQGSTDVWYPPEPGLFAWTGPDPNYPYMAFIDYVGAADKWLVENGHESLGTEVQGTFTRREVGDGLVEYSANVHATNALAWTVVALDGDGNWDGNTMLFGDHAYDVLDGATPALGSANFKATWRQSGEDPIADINLAQNYCGEWDDDGNCLDWPYRPAGWQMLDADMRGTADGPLHAAAGLGPEGTPGKLVVSQTNSNPQAFGHGQGGNGWGFPAEVVKLTAAGN